MFEFRMNPSGKISNCYNIGRLEHSPSKSARVRIFVVQPIFEACRNYASSKNESTTFWTDNATFAFTRTPCDVYEQRGDELVRVADGFIVPVYGELPSTFRRKLTSFASCGATPVKFAPQGSEFLTRDEALKRVEQYIANDKPYRVTMRYGSEVYGQSRDRDLLSIIGYGQRFKELAEKFENVPVRPGDDVIYISIRNTVVHPMERLAAECLTREQPATRDLFAGWIERMSLEEALHRNTEYRLNLARFFPCDFTLRKAIFAQAQYNAYTRDGVFLDNKEAALAYCANKDEVRRLFFHKASLRDIERLYYATFELPLPDDVRVVKSHRSLYILRGRHIYRSEYYSHYGYDNPELVGDNLNLSGHNLDFAEIADPHDDAVSDVLYQFNPAAAG